MLRQMTSAEMARYRASRVQPAQFVHPTGQGRDGIVHAQRVSGQAVMAQFRARKALGALPEKKPLPSWAAMTIGMFIGMIVGPGILIAIQKD